MQSRMLEEKTFLTQFGKDMKRARREQGMTQNDLAVQMQLLGVDVSESRVQKLETGVLRMSVNEMLVISYLLFIDLNSRAAIYARASGM